MKRFLLVTSLLVLASLLAACAGAEAPAGTVAPTQTAWVVTATPDAVATSVAATVQALAPESTAIATTVAPDATAMPVVVSNSLVNPELFDAGEDPAGEADPGLFDIGVNAGQLGIVFGWNLSWGENSIEGEGCEIVVLSGGWYENFEILDGRYEIYTLPSSDPTGWTQVLIDQRVVEQATHYGCDSKVVPPVWEGGK